MYFVQISVRELSLKSKSILLSFNIALCPFKCTTKLSVPPAFRETVRPKLHAETKNPGIGIRHCQTLKHHRKSLLRHFFRRRIFYSLGL